jgi:hypothetical protein
VTCSPPKISETFRASSFVSLAFFTRCRISHAHLDDGGFALCDATTLTPQALNRHWFGCAFARITAMGYLIRLGPPSGAHDREHGGSGADDRGTTANTHTAA